MALASTIRRKLGVMGALALGAFLAPNAAHADTNLVFCNNTGARVYVALIYYPVSYTHLDVYKRQHQIMMRNAR